MPEIKPPQDHVEIAVYEVETKLRSMFTQLYGPMTAADISACGAFDRLAVMVDRTTDDDKRAFALTAKEFRAFQAVFDNIEAVRQSLGMALVKIEAARERYTDTRGKGELEKLLGLFEAQDNKITE
ncbi:hypothetical protein [Agrobacterium radiobacter]|uniref:hypothetical protein n=1 Tax=Agrobacterium radiobacter TaxID=362 RepID=UPI003CE5A8A1